MSEVIRISDLYKDIEATEAYERFNLALDKDPKVLFPQLIKQHPQLRHQYLDIDTCEWLLKSLFKKYRIEVRSSEVMANAIAVTVRVHYLHPVSNEIEFHDGVGAMDLQTAKGAAPADLGAINSAAVQKALPAAKAYAIKDACDHFGRIFGSALSSKTELALQADENLKSKAQLAKELNGEVEAPEPPKRKKKETPAPPEVVAPMPEPTPQVEEIPAPPPPVETPPSPPPAPKKDEWSLDD